ncbi:hypothetical protein G6N76_10205 [Rhizobium daejeonense]|uniref:Uncharacterized protein n=1 Tax=Rhizobium daejeonense TaxID=240521 RepID=A0A6M1SBG4_9HYPH|nr:hypothetical protein [Rhizobium daejeonense]NGO64046.1 hypothetical protein [Rhizobium daejeonense]
MPFDAETIATKIPKENNRITRKWAGILPGIAQDFAQERRKSGVFPKIAIQTGTLRASDWASGSDLL